MRCAENCECRRHAHCGPPSRSLAERFEVKVVRGIDDACDIWEAARTPNGYGVIGSGGKFGTNLLAHRVAWEIANGLIPNGMWVLHRCDVRLCVKPEHLFLGTRQDNMDDMVAKGRAAHNTGERHGQSKLTEKDAREIRRLYYSERDMPRDRVGKPSGRQYTHRSLAEKFGASPSNVYAIVNHKTWRNVA